MPHPTWITCPAWYNAEGRHRNLPSDAQQIYDGLANDKTQVSIDADHYFTPRAPAAKQADANAKWIAKRWRWYSHHFAGHR